VAAAGWPPIDLPGALSAVFIGTVITASLGLRGFALMAAFFVLGSLVTRLGYRVKAARGIAQEKGGARGWRNAWANGGVPALLALMAASRRATSGSDLLPTPPVATAAADTCSEVGKAYYRRTFLITSLRPVPLNGGRGEPRGTLGGPWRGAGGGLGVPGLTPGGVPYRGGLGQPGRIGAGHCAERKGWLTTIC
jgi:uncharacterized protein (TIGR00297 family)